MTSRYKTVVFDLDGTLLNTLEDLWRSVNFALDAHGMALREFEDVRRFVGNGIPRLIHLSVPEGTSADAEAEVLATFREHYAAHSADHTAPYAGIPELLEHLHEADLKVAVASNKADAPVQALVEGYFPGAFDAVMGECEDRGIPRKPAPAMVEALLRKMGCTHDGLVYVGDSEVDLLTAANVGCSCLSCSWGFRNVEELRAAGAETIVDTPDELERVLLASK